jgi:hypothetical protein
MRCVFCKQASDRSKSVEHIVPESLGSEHVLPRGIVCDACNNYLAREVEKPFLDSSRLREDRFVMSVPSKKGRIPSLRGLLSPLAVPVEIGRGTTKPDMWIQFADDRARGEPSSPESGTLYFPVGAYPEDRVVVRFIGKIGLETLAARFVGAPELLDELVDHSGLDDLRALVRRGMLGNLWPYSRRRIYAVHHRCESEGTLMETLHEFDLLYTESQELFLVAAIFGVEYALNLGEPSIDGYMRWLDAHRGVSPLYNGRNPPGRLMAKR